MISYTARRALAASRVVAPRAAHGRRSFWNVSLPVLGGPGGAHITKYNIVRNAKEGVEYDDFLIALPEREHLASFTKEVPLFVRYLKVVTDQEGRQEDFAAFFERAKSGLVVESDVYISTEELLAVMWKNGYSEQERNAIQFTFPADYKFHYPELSAMFSLAEEDTYKFCMRTRMENSHIGELDHAKVKRQGLIRDHWMIFGVGIVTLKYFPFFNYYFGIKVFGTSMWCFTVWSLMNRMIARVCRRNEYMASQKTAQDVMDGEDAIVQSMKRFANDAKCVDYLGQFKAETEASVGSYKKAVVMQMQDDMTERAAKQLQSIANFEAGMGSALQELVVKEAASSFKEKFPADKAMQDQAFSAAVKGLGGDALAAGDDPVGAHFTNAFKSLEGVDLMKTKGNSSGTLAERLAFAQQQQESDFQQTFMVTPQEVAEVKALVKQAGPDFDFSKLPEDASKKLDSLYTSINAKVGFAIPALPMKAIETTHDASANSYIEQVNTNLAQMGAQLRNNRLKAFAQAFQ